MKNDIEMWLSIVKISWNAWKFPEKVYFPILLYRAQFPENDKFLAKFPEIRKFPEKSHVCDISILWQVVWELKNGIEILIGQAIFELLIGTILYMFCLTYWNSNVIWKILRQYASEYLSYFSSVDTFWYSTQNILNFDLRCSSSLTI